MKRLLLLAAVVILGTATLEARDPDVNSTLDNIELYSGQFLPVLCYEVTPVTYSWQRISGTVYFTDQRHTHAYVHGTGPFKFVYKATYNTGQTITVTVSGVLRSGNTGGGGGDDRGNLNDDIRTTLP